MRGENHYIEHWRGENHGAELNVGEEENKSGKDGQKDGKLRNSWCSRWIIVQLSYKKYGPFPIEGGELIINLIPRPFIDKIIRLHKNIAVVIGLLTIRKCTSCHKRKS